MSLPAQPPRPPDPWEQFTRDLILERFGRTCPELPQHEREAKRAADRAAQRRLEDLAADRVGLVVALPIGDADEQEVA